MADNPLDSRSVPPPHHISNSNPQTPDGAQQVPSQTLNTPNHDPFAADPKDGLTTPTLRDENGDCVLPPQPLPPKSNQRKWIIRIGLAGFASIIIIVAVVLGIVLSRKSSSSGEKSPSLSSSSSSSSSSGGTATSIATGTVTLTPISSDPSTFVKDPALRQSFYGIAYAPAGSQLGPGSDCSSSLEAVIKDIQILSQLTKRIRLYGADCNQTALVLEAIKQTKVDMSVFTAISPTVTETGLVYGRQRDALLAAIRAYGTDHIAGVTLGNEFMLEYATNAGTLDPNSDVANAGARILLYYMNDARSMLSGMGVKLPVGNAESGNFINNQVLQSIDYGLATVHPWFAKVSARDGAAWIADFFQKNVVTPAKSLPSNPTMYIGETGWPTDGFNSSDTGSANNGASAASVENLQIFLDNFVCTANANGVGYFFSEFSDDEWKDKLFGGVLGWWGLFNKDRTLKAGITIPDCTADAA